MILIRTIHGKTAWHSLVQYGSTVHGGVLRTVNPGSKIFRHYAIPIRFVRPCYYVDGVVLLSLLLLLLLLLMLLLLLLLRCDNR